MYIFTLKIYNDFDGMELSNELYAMSGWVEFKGFNTYNLESDIYLDEGDDFYIYLYLETGGQPYDRTSEVPVLLGGDQKTLVESNADPEESYYKEDGTWFDFFQLR